MQTDTTMTHCAVLPTESPLGRRIMQINGIRVRETENNTPQRITGFIILFHRIRNAFSCILRPFNAMRIYLRAIFIVYLHPVTGKVCRIPAVSRDNLFPDNTLGNIPIWVQFHIVDFTRQQRSPILHTSHTNTHFQNGIRFFVDSLQHKGGRIGNHVFLSLLQCILPTRTFHIHQQAVSVIICRIRFAPRVHAFQFFLHLFIKPGGRLRPSESRICIYPQRIESCQCKLFVAAF